MLKHRIKKIEQRLLIKAKTMKLWDVKFGESVEKQLADIAARRVRHPNGSFYSEKDSNVFFDFDLFMPGGTGGELAQMSSPKD